MCKVSWVFAASALQSSLILKVMHWQLSLPQVRSMKILASHDQVITRAKAWNLQRLGRLSISPKSCLVGIQYHYILSEFIEALTIMWLGTEEFQEISPKLNSSSISKNERNDKMVECSLFLCCSFGVMLSYLSFSPTIMLLYHHERPPMVYLWHFYRIWIPFCLICRIQPSLDKSNQIWPTRGTWLISPTHQMIWLISRTRTFWIWVI